MSNSELKVSAGFKRSLADVRIIKANYFLQSKIGSGPLDERLIVKAQKAMDQDDTDFVPIAKNILSDLGQAIKAARSDETGRLNAHVNALTAPVMQLKANGAVFGYPLLGGLANIMLGFLEGIERLDDDALRIVEAHYETLNAIVSNKIRGDGGEVGLQMQDELSSACRRYFERHS